MNSSPGTGNLTVDLSGLDGNPSCPHGPTILFHRNTGKPSGKSGKGSFYACSAYRDRKECQFYLPFSAKKSSSRTSSALASEPTPSKTNTKHQNDIVRGECVLSRFCQRCSRLLGDSEEHKHQEIIKVDPRFPTRFLPVFSKDPGEAQYFFSESTTRFLVELVRTMEVKRVLCVGCPRIHEELLSIPAKTSQPKSFLLDIDGRLESFLPDFAKYNMFNHHFFAESGKRDYLSFVAGSACQDLLIVIDPPFGGLVQVLANNLRRLFAQIGGESKILWIFPYFMEKRVLSEFPTFNMLDYKCEYSNHRKLMQSSRGSPVRIFTNIAPAAVLLPEEEGYWFCGDCEKWCSGENKHCFVCGVCPSKDGKAWKHCKKCAICVKGDWNHCDKCQRCHSRTCVAVK